MRVSLRKRKHASANSVAGSNSAGTKMITGAVDHLQERW